MKTSRANEPFSRSELEQILDDREAARDEVGAHMAQALLSAEEMIDKEVTTRKVLLREASAVAVLTKATSKEDSILWKVANNLCELVDGIRGEDRSPSEDGQVTDLGDGIFKIAYKGMWASRILAEGCASMLRKSDGSKWNNITYVMNYLDGDTYHVEVNRKSGKSAAKQRDEAEAKLAETEAKLKHWQTRALSLEREAQGCCAVLGCKTPHAEGHGHYVPEAEAFFGSCPEHSQDRNGELISPEKK